jgi:hypothetical protein
MNDLKKFAGLLNDEAPENHFLAYITPGERDMLVDAGGVKTPTPSGIFAYPPQDNQTSSYDSSQNTSGRTSSTSGAGGGSGYSGGQGRQDTESQYTGGGYDSSKNTSGRTTTTSGAGGGSGYINTSNNNDDIDSTYTSTSFDVTPEKSAMDKLKDFIASGGIIGNTFKAISNFAESHNKKRRNNFMSTADIKEYELGTGKNWNPNNVTNKDSAEYKYLKNETDYFQQFNNDDNRNENDPSSFFDNPQDVTESNLINNPNPFSQVDNYFNNMESNNLGISQNFMNSYDQAKADLAKTLNMTTNASQFGYNANMSSSNIYYNYLKEQGLL